MTSGRRWATGRRGGPGAGAARGAGGGGFPPRLFLELRERRGLVYDVHSYVSQFLDTGLFTVYAGVDPKKAPEAVRVIVEEGTRLQADGPASDEMTKARELSKGRLLLRMEDTRAVSGWLGGQELLLSEVRTIDQAVAEMEAVTLEALQRGGGQVLGPAGVRLAIGGPYRSDKRFAGLLA